MVRRRSQPPAADTAVEERVELLLAQAGSLAAIGQFSESHAALIECLALAPAKATAQRVRLITACAGVEHLLGRHQEAHLRLLDALDDLEDECSAEGVALMIELAVDGFYRMEYEADARLGRTSPERCPSPRKPTADGCGARAVAYAATLDGAMAEAKDNRSEAVVLVDALSDEELALRLDAAVNLAAAELDLERFAEAGAHAERAMAVGEATGQSDIVPILVYCLAWVRRRRGELASSAELLDDAVESARLSGNDHSLAGNLLNQSLTALAAGDIELALTAAAESVDLSARFDKGLVSASASHALASALLEHGAAAEAVEALIGCCGGSRLPAHPERLENPFPRAADPVLARARPTSTKPAKPPPRRQCAPRRSGCASPPHSRIGPWRPWHLHRGSSTLAAEKALASATVADAVGVPIEAALSRMLAGRALAQDGELERATAELTKAAEAFHSSGALRYRDQAEQQLRQFGQHIHRRTRAGKSDGVGVELLTERQLQIARLVVARRTNPQIASELFLSQKTIESHMHNMFHKVGVSSRVDLARAVERADRTTGSGTQ